MDKTYKRWRLLSKPKSKGKTKKRRIQKELNRKKEEKTFEKVVVR
jgi:hypothetical protein